MTVHVAKDAVVKSDGRHVRRARNRDSAIDALMALLDEGAVNPTVADIAARAGLSPRSMFRYFDDGADLTREAITRMNARVAPILATMDIDPSRSVHERVEEVARAADALYEAAKWGALEARRRSPGSPIVAEQVVSSRLLVRELLARAFAPELDARPADERSTWLAAVEVWCTFETQHLLRSQGHVEGPDPVAVTIVGLTSLLSGAS